eukprot:2049478-Rhodomonas_salina.1
MADNWALLQTLGDKPVSELVDGQLSLSAPFSPHPLPRMLAFSLRNPPAPLQFPAGACRSRLSFLSAMGLMHRLPSLACFSLPTPHAR